MPVALVDWPSTFGKRPGYVTPRSPVLSLGRARLMARKRSTDQTPLLDIPRPLPPPPLPDLHQRLRATLDAAQWGLSHAVHLESRDVRQRGIMLEAITLLPPAVDAKSRRLLAYLELATNGQRTHAAYGEPATLGRTLHLGPASAVEHRIAQLLQAERLEAIALPHGRTCFRVVVTAAEWQAATTACRAKWRRGGPEAAGVGDKLPGEDRKSVAEGKR